MYTYIHTYIYVYLCIYVYNAGVHCTLKGRAWRGGPCVPGTTKVWGGQKDPPKIFDP